MKAQYKLAGFASALAISLFAASASAEPTSMQNVMAVAIDSNPQIHQSEMNKQAIEFELDQAKGLYLSRITLEMSAGVLRLENSTRPVLGIDGNRKSTRLNSSHECAARMPHTACNKTTHIMTVIRQP